MPKTFHCAGVVDASQHYLVNRNSWHETMTEEARKGSFKLMHGHRQAGKSTAAKAVNKALSAAGQAAAPFLVIPITFESISVTDAKQAWQQWDELVRHVLSELRGHFETRGLEIPTFYTVYDLSKPAFNDGASFIAMFATALWAPMRIVLILDEFDTILFSPQHVKDEWLTALRSMRTANNIALEGVQPYALHAVLGVGVHRVLQLTLSADEGASKVSPFNVSDAVVMPIPTIEDVRDLFREVAKDHEMIIDEAVVDDIFWRSGGHVGLLSLLGKVILNIYLNQLKGKAERRIDSTIWGASMGGNTLYVDARKSATFGNMIKALSARFAVNETIKRARTLVRQVMCAPDDADLDIAASSNEDRGALEYLLSEGILIQVKAEANTRYRLTAPFLVPLLMEDLGSSAAIARMPSLPFPRGPGDIIDLYRSVLEVLPYVDLEALYHPLSLLVAKTPCEYAYHFQLFDLLRHRSSDGGWRVLGETRNAVEKGPRRRLDILIASNGCRCGIELLAEGAEITKHVQEQAPIYAKQQNLQSILVVNFATSAGGIVAALAENAPDKVSVMQIFVDRAAKQLTPYRLDPVTKAFVRQSSVSVLPDVPDIAAGLEKMQITPATKTVRLCDVEFTVTEGSNVNAFLMDAECELDKASLVLFRREADKVTRIARSSSMVKVIELPVGKLEVHCDLEIYSLEVIA